MEVESDLAEKVAKVSLDFFRKDLPKKGKPKSGEWTVFSAILMEKDGQDNLEVLSAATGSKCLGEQELSAQGDLVGDAHAEVLARRGLVRRLLGEVRNKGGTCLENTGSKYRMKDGCKLHLFVTHPPCGDATISYKEEYDDDDSNKRYGKRPKRDQVRTGAKCLNGEEDDRAEDGDYHTALGALRRKPGRGPPTRSAACSDKIMKWSILGVQGSMLSHLLVNPIYLSSVIICSSLACLSSIKRALITRTASLRSQMKIPTLKIGVIKQDLFEYSWKEGLNASPCCSTYYSCLGTERKGVFQVCIDGRRQGCVRKHFGTAKARLDLCRIEVAREFVAILNDSKVQKLSDEHIKYCDLKVLDKSHQTRKEKFKEAFPGWPRRDRDKYDRFVVLDEKSSETGLIKSS